MVESTKAFQDGATRWRDPFGYSQSAKIPIIFVRLLNEEKVLFQELPGYPNIASAPASGLSPSFGRNPRAADARLRQISDLFSPAFTGGSPRTSSLGSRWSRLERHQNERVLAH